MPQYRLTGKYCVSPMQGSIQSTSYVMTPYIFDAADDMKAVEEFGRYEKHKLDRDKLAIHEPKLMRLSVPTPVPIALPERLPV